MTMGTFQKFCLRWNNHSSNFVGNLGLILASEEYSDVTVCCQGEVWHLHQLVLSASSSHFAQLLRHTPPGKTPILILDGPPASDVHALIHFIYHGEVNVDHDSLPSLLRTAASLRIKGLADVTGLTQEINSDPFPIEGEANNATVLTTPCASIVSNNGTDDLSPLNLSCNKTNHLKDEEEINEESSNIHPVSVAPVVQEVEPKENSHKEQSDVFILPPAKRVRTQEPQPPPGVTSATIIAPSDSQIPVTESTYTPISTSQIMRNVSSTTDNVVISNLDSCPIKDPVPQKTPLAVKRPLEKTRVFPPKGSTTYYNVPSNASFPLLNMAFSPHVAYQQSSTTQPSIEVIRTENSSMDITVPVSKVCDLSLTSSNYETKPPPIQATDHNQAIHDRVRYPPVTEIASPVAIYSSHHVSTNPVVEVCSSSTNEQEVIISDEKIANQNYSATPSENNENSPPAVEEKTFNHKKFSPCIIPNSNTSPKTVHVLGSVYAPHTVPTNPYIIKKENVAEHVPINNNENSVNNITSEILIQSPSIVKLTPVAVTSYCTNVNANATFPANSILYTTSSGAPLKSCDNSALSTPAPIISVPKGCGTQVEEVSNPHPQQESVESTENSFALSPPASYPTASVVTTTEGTTSNTQRVTINMRTFKEEWRRQLLVDYDSRTNMSICMLCFTTFKSYDGPRKNTYVKHAKRFHPALEDYSDEERGVIISMYEKYHKYDIDMQKEINKSFRTTNGSGSSLKRHKNSDAGLPVPINAFFQSRIDTEGESSEEKGDSANESKGVDSYGPSRESGSASEGTGTDNDGIQDMEISNNNNNNLNDKNAKKKVEVSRDVPITS